MRTHFLVTTLLAGALLAVLPACGGDTERLTVYSGRTEDLIGPLLTQFSEETGIGVDVRYADSADLALLIEEEEDSSPADVVISQSPGALGFLAGGGRLAPLSEDVLGQVDEAYRSPDGRWVGLSGRVRSLVYDPEEVDADDLPSSVFDLVDDAYRAEVALAPTNGSFQDFVTAMRELEGDEAASAWLEGMQANDNPTYDNNTAIVQAVARGEVPFGLVNHYYALRLLEEDPNASAANHFFDDGDLGALLLVTGAGVVEGTEQADDAERLVSFLLGESSQRFFAEETLEYPLVEGVDPGESVPPLEDIEVPEFRLDTLGGGLARTQELIDESGL